MYCSAVGTVSALAWPAFGRCLAADRRHRRELVTRSRPSSATRPLLARGIRFPFPQTVDCLGPLHRHLGQRCRLQSITHGAGTTLVYNEMDMDANRLHHRAAPPSSASTNTAHLGLWSRAEHSGRCLGDLRPTFPPPP